MDEKDAKIRKQWLVVYSLNMIQSAFWFVLALFFNPQLAGLDYNPYPGLIGGFVTVFGMGYVMYHCIYKKTGTKLVTFLLIIAFLGLFVTPVLLITGKMNSLYPIPYFGVLQAFSYLLGVCWIAVCWRIRKVNQKLRVATIK